MAHDRPTGCKARQYSDQMQCECGLLWDVNDPDPPECQKPAAVTTRQDIVEQIKLKLLDSEEGTGK